MADTHYKRRRSKKRLWSPDGKNEPVKDFLASAGLHDNFATDYLSLGGDVRFGKAGGDVMTWDRAIKEQLGTIGRVCKDPKGANRYWVQFFMFLLFNDADAVFDQGDHEGDWLCLDMDVDASSPASPRIVRVFYHNHGQVFAVPGDQAPRAQDGRVIAYMEGGSNELWPSMGNELPAGTKTFFKTDTFIRDHKGKSGIIYPFQSVLNVGEKEHPMPYATPKAEEVRLFFLPVHWGAWWRDFDEGGIIGLGFSTSSPKSPPHNEKMWNRKDIE